MKKIIIALLIVGALAGGYVYFFMLNKAHPDYEHLQADLSIQADELFNACRDENRSAEFTGKIIELSGAPTELEINDSLHTLVYIFDDGMFGAEGIRATFLPNYSTDLEKLPLNQTLKIKAFCTGYNGTDVILEKASLIH